MLIYLYCRSVSTKINSSAHKIKYACYTSHSPTNDTQANTNAVLIQILYTSVRKI